MTASYRRSRKISAVCSMHSTRGTILSMLDGSRRIFLSIYWICGSNTLCSASSARQQEIFASWRLITKIMKISRYTVVLSLPPRLIPVLLNGMKYSELDIIILKVLVCMCLYLLSWGMPVSYCSLSGPFKELLYNVFITGQQCLVFDLPIWCNITDVDAQKSVCSSTWTMSWQSFTCLVDVIRPQLYCLCT